MIEAWGFTSIRGFQWKLFLTHVMYVVLTSKFGLVQDSVFMIVNMSIRSLDVRDV